jgi:hypothetical protein
MRSPGRPDPSRVVQRQFWRLIATGIATAEASLAVGVSWPSVLAGFVTLAACRRSRWPSPPAAI